MRLDVSFYCLLSVRLLFAVSLVPTNLILYFQIFLQKRLQCPFIGDLALEGTFRSCTQLSNSTLYLTVFLVLSLLISVFVLLSFFTLVLYCVSVDGLL